MIDGVQDFLQSRFCLSHRADVLLVAIENKLKYSKLTNNDFTAISRARKKADDHMWVVGLYRDGPRGQQRGKNVGKRDQNVGKVLDI